jgi:hypothetical protein
VTQRSWSPCCWWPSRAASGRGSRRARWRTHDGDGRRERAERRGRRGTRERLLQQRGLVAAYMLDDGAWPGLNDWTSSSRLARGWPMPADRAHRRGTQSPRAARDVYADYDASASRPRALPPGAHAAGAQAALGDVSRLSDEAYGLCRDLYGGQPEVHGRVLERGPEGGLAGDGPSGIGRITTCSAWACCSWCRVACCDRCASWRGTPDRSPPRTDAARRLVRGRVHALEFYSRELMTDVTARAPIEVEPGQAHGGGETGRGGTLRGRRQHEIPQPLTSIRIVALPVRQAPQGPRDGARPTA